MQGSVILPVSANPKGNAKGYMHVAQLAFSEEAYPGQGVYLSDALLLLEQRGLDEFTGTAITERPSAALQELSTF